ncbi:MAG: thrombospondin type 3 repeat-containing protein [Candidatus Thalassarchaeaceae archaeon]|nr:thrombospondin type 3 repeat-containing protein [Candidatus Thalassarchaeaceae archaeon]
MTSQTQHFATDCNEPGNVSLEDDWDEGSMNGTLEANWMLTDLIVGQSYAFDWAVRINYGYVEYGYEIWEAASENMSIPWSFNTDNSTTCNVEVWYRLFVDVDDTDGTDYREMDSEWYYWYPDCDEWVYPEDSYVNFHVDVNGTWEELGYESNYTMPMGENDLEIHFENLSVGATYGLYLYYSGTGFNSHSDYHYFTYDGSTMEIPISIAPWACSMYFSWDMELFDFRFPDNYNSWWMGSESFYVDGPCESMSYDWDQDRQPTFEVVGIEDGDDLLEGVSNVTLSADGQQSNFPYYMELQVRYDGYLNIFEMHSWFGDNTSTEEMTVAVDVPGFVCEVNVRAYMYVWTGDNSHSQTNYTEIYADGPCDGSDGDAEMQAPLYAMINGSWALVDDDTMFEPGETQMYWDLSWMGDQRHYLYFSSPNYGWGDFVTADDGPLEWTMVLNEFWCDVYFYYYADVVSDYTGWHRVSDTNLYPGSDCIEDAGEITLEVDGVAYESDSGYDYELMPGTTSFSWALDGLLDGYDYEFYWYQGGSECCPHEYEYFTADSTGEESFDFYLTIDEHECYVYYYAYLRPMSEITGNYEQTASFHWHPEEPCVPVFDLVAADADGNMTVDALAEGFALAPGNNTLMMDFSGMGDGNEYWLEWYYDDSEGWYGWYYDDIGDNNGSNASSYMLEFDLWMDDMDCEAHIYARVVNTTDGQWDEIGNYDIYLDGPCMLPIELDSQNDESEVYSGTNEMTLIVDFLDEGSNYSLEYYYSMSTGWYGWYDHDFTFSGTESVTFDVNVTDWDCNVYIYANLNNVTDGNYSSVYSDSFWLENPDCYEFHMDLTDESGDYISHADIEAGVTELVWTIDFDDENLPIGYEFELTWFYLSDWDWNSQVEGSYAWTQSSDSEIQIPWNVSATDFDCQLYASAQLRLNTTDGWINLRGYGTYLYPPCEPMPSGWFTLQIDDQGIWDDYWEGWNNRMTEEGTYDLRFNASGLEEGVIYEIQWNVSVYGHEIESHSVELNTTGANSTVVDFTLEIPHWYCGIVIQASLMFDYEGAMVESESRDFFEDGPCQTSLDGDFSSVTEVEFELEMIGEGDYKLIIPLHWELDEEFEVFADMAWGDGDGSLNSTEIAIIEDEINNGSDGEPDEAPEFMLNGVYASSWDLDGPAISDLASDPTFSLTWVCYYYDVSGVELTVDVYFSQEEGDIPWEFAVYGNEDLSPLSAVLENMDNGSVYDYPESNNTIEFGIDSVDEFVSYSLSITWIWEDIPIPSLDVEQFDANSSEYGPTTSLEEGWNSFRIGLEGLAPQEYTLYYTIMVDGAEIENLTINIWQDYDDYSYETGMDVDIFVCDAEISATVYDRNGVEANSTSVILQGICAQPEMDVEQFYPEWESPDFVCHVIAGDPTSSLQYVNFSLVNDGTEDCGDGSDEPFDMDPSTDSDGDGNSTNDHDSWFDCYDGTTVNMDVVNDGNDDCFHGEDEYSFSQSYWGIPTTAIGYSMGSYDYDIETRVLAYNLSHMYNWTIEYEVLFDGVYDNSSGTVNVSSGAEFAAAYFNIIANIEVCNIEINTMLIENGAPVISTEYNLTGECVQDSDSDGYLDWYDSFPDDPNEWNDADSDGYGDNSDSFPYDSGEWNDTDSDGYGDNSDEFPNDPNEWSDLDGDGIGDNADTDDDGDGIDDDDDDSDGDGVPDSQDDFPEDANETTDSDGDGVGDNADDFPDDASETSDWDGDGVGDNADEFPYDSNETTDSDGDGVGDNADEFPDDSGETTDSDGDGVGDNSDDFPEDPNESSDSDGDGVGDNEDDFPEDATETTDSDGDGVGDNSDEFPEDPNESSDSDGDGVGDNEDDFPEDANETSDYDGDGVGDNSDEFPYDANESSDTDGDGVGDNEDDFPEDPNESSDSDGDGVGDNADEFPDDSGETTDSDGDGVGDNSDEFPDDANETADSDGDGMGDNSDDFPYDANETTDSDGDGVGDNADDFPNDANETTDTDGDGIGNNEDTDDDGDGIDDDQDDSDGDGVYDDEDDFPYDANETTDSDGDGVGDNADEFPYDSNETTDSDGDGVGDNADDFPEDATETTDSDGDGVGDNSDEFPEDPNESSDSDGDGVGDNSDEFPDDANETSDWDGDGIGDNGDEFPNDPDEWVDTDGDGVGDNGDDFPDDANETTDTDGDGIGDNADADSDDDGVDDNSDDFPYDANETTDSDGDGVGDNGDDFPDDANETTDSDGDGWGDNSDAFPDDPTEFVDSDGDGVGNFADDFPFDANETADSDGDGWGDNSDDFPTDPSEWSDFDGDGVGDNSDDFPWDSTESADSDGDGWGDNADEFPDDPDEWVDTDGDGTGDNADTDADGDGIDDDAEDSDGDGVYDDEDDFPFDANETADSDGDGVGDNADEFPDDANETTDTDGDGIGDNSDDDADGDGQPNDLDDFPLNGEETADSDGDGVGDNEDAFPDDPSENIDADGDGIGDNADIDDDNDGTPDTSDDFPFDPNETTDTDNDGIGDNADAFPSDPYERYDSDGDGVGDNSDDFPSDPDEWVDTDGDGWGDNTDAFPSNPSEFVDSDGDGVGDNTDAFPYDGSETKDSDGNGVGDNAQAAQEEPEPEPVDEEDGGLFGLPGFSAATSLASMLGAAILIAGRRKD